MLHTPMAPQVDSSIIEYLDTTLVRALLSADAQRQFSQGNIADRELAPYVKVIQELSKGYTEDAPPHIRTPEQATAYALYYLPLNFIKVCHLLRQIPGPLPPKLSVLDFGCGPGTASLAALSLLPCEISLTAVDRSDSMRSLGRTLCQALVSSAGSPSSPIKGALTSAHFLPSHPSSPPLFDLILAANVLNELSDTEAIRTAQSLLARLSPHGYLILLEPALKASTHLVMRVRDALLNKSPTLVPLFPCTRRDPCPMLRTRPHDWCHGSLEGMGRDFHSSQLVQHLDRLSGFNKHRIKYSGFVFQQNGRLTEGIRVLRDATVRGKLVQLEVCGTNSFEAIEVKKSSIKRLHKVRQFDLLPDASSFRSE